MTDMNEHTDSDAIDDLGPGLHLEVIPIEREDPRWKQVWIWLLDESDVRHEDEYKNDA